MTGDARSPMGLRLPPSEVAGVTPVSRTGARIGSRAHGGASHERMRVARFSERAAIYDTLRRHAGEVLAYQDLAAMLGLDRKLVSGVVGTMFRHPDDYPDITRVVRGTVRYDGPPHPEAGAPAPPSAPLPVQAPLPDLEGSGPAPGAAGLPDVLLLTVLRPVPGGHLAWDDDEMVAWVVRRATAADLRAP